MTLHNPANPSCACKACRARRHIPARILERTVRAFCAAALQCSPPIVVHPSSVLRGVRDHRTTAVRKAVIRELATSYSLRAIANALRIESSYVSAIVGRRFPPHHT